IELFSEFSCTGGTYIPFPTPSSHRLFLKDLKRPDVRDRLKAVWSDPEQLDPTKRSARVTREIATQLAKLAVSLEKAGHSPENTSAFLMRCLFTMFAEDVGLLMRGSFTNLLESLRDTPEHFVPMVEELWSRMNSGGFSTTLRMNILKFNGGLFADSSALPMTKDQLQLLIEAAKSDWQDVEPAIFGTLLERALAPVERHKLGAHYTPRSYVERLVMPTVINPIRKEWEAVHVAAITLANQDEIKNAVSEVKKFHRKLCQIRVLDPACGSGNFLYVTLEHLKRIEGEILDTLKSMGETQALLEMEGETVDPHQFLGLEVNPRAADIAELVLWIGTLQWHFRNRGNVQPPQPIIRNFHNIECRDALIEWDSVEEVIDADGTPVTHWDGRTTKPHPVTGKEVPDETARIPVYNYINPRKTEWPQADYIIGNPPFIGPARMRDALGDGYTETVRKIHNDVGESSDFVMYWWNHAAELACANKVQRFGFITTNSLRQKFNRRVLETHMAAKKPLSLLFAISDHPWVDSSDGAAVRIAMTAAAAGEHQGLLQEVISEKENDGDGYDIELVSATGTISADLRVGAIVSSAHSLVANAGLAVKGFELGSQGFLVDIAEAKNLLDASPPCAVVLKPYMNGKDLINGRVSRYVIDFYPMSQIEARAFPQLFQAVLDNVQPERQVNRESRTVKHWWTFRRSGNSLRRAIAGLDQIICTTRTAKHRVFQFMPGNLVAESKIVVVATNDSHTLGVLSSSIHASWALRAGAFLTDRPTYNHLDCFNKFPFPDATEEQKTCIRKLAEDLDAHRKRQQGRHPNLTLTGMYNVLEKLRSGEALSAKDKTIHEQGLVSVLKQLHDELDKAVFDAYGWSDTLTDEEILERLVALNSERSAEEAQGKIRWLRPEFQNPQGSSTEQQELDVDDKKQAPKVKRSASIASRAPWPKSLPDQVRVLREVLADHTTPATAETIARQFTRARKDKVEEILQTLVTLGQAREVEDGRFVGG
ncbi:MAG: class I SAM-dependent DNA methyltransferase, partial [Deltaproteobacteria bacterium]